MENKIRNTLNEIYFGKTKDIVNGLRSVLPLADANKTRDLQVKLSLYNYLSLPSFVIIRHHHDLHHVYLQKELLQTLHQKNAGQTN